MKMVVGILRYLYIYIFDITILQKYWTVLLAAFCFHEIQAANRLSLIQD